MANETVQFAHLPPRFRATQWRGHVGCRREWNACGKRIGPRVCRHAVGNPSIMLRPLHFTEHQLNHSLLVSGHHTLSTAVEALRRVAERRERKKLRERVCERSHISAVLRDHPKVEAWIEVMVRRWQS